MHLILFKMFVDQRDSKYLFRVQVKKAIPRSSTPGGSRLEPAAYGAAMNPNRLKQIFIGGLAPTATNKDVKDYFQLYGAVLEAQVWLRL
jgi:hypothetical protein